MLKLVFVCLFALDFFCHPNTCCRKQFVIDIVCLPAIQSFCLNNNKTKRKNGKKTRCAYTKQSQCQTERKVETLKTTIRTHNVSIARHDGLIGVCHSCFMQQRSNQLIQISQINFNKLPTENV